MPAEEHVNSIARPNIRNYPMQAWWVAALGSEITDLPLPRRIAGVSMVFFRDSSGRVAVLRDRCPHRWLPLSRGKVVGDDIQCGYHGIRFNRDGACAGIPTQDSIPASMTVDAFPVREQNSLIWVWTGRRDKAETIEPPVTPWLGAGWASTLGRLHIEANYILGHENVMDLTHFGFLHEGTLAIPAGYDEPPPLELDVRDDSVYYRIPFPAMKLDGDYRAGPTGIGEQRTIHREEYGEFVSPAIHVGGSDVVTTDEAIPRRFETKFIHMFTPETNTTCHYFWAASRNWAIEDDVITEALAKNSAVPFEQDRQALGAIQQVILEDPGYKEVSIRADRAALQVRKLLQKILAADSET